MHSALRKFRDFFLFSFIFLLFCFSCKQNNSEQKTDAFKVEVQKVENGEIICRDINGQSFTGLDNVKVGTELVFTLKANDGYTPSKLVIDGKEFKTLTTIGHIEETVKITKSIKVSGECVVKPSHFKINITQVENGEILCKDDEGKDFNDFDSCEDGKELTFILKSTNENYIPKRLIIGNTYITTLNSKNEIVESITVHGNLNISGEMVPKSLEVVVKDVANGKIVVKDDSEQEISELNRIDYGTDVKVVLSANDGYTPSKLIIGGMEYATLEADGTITQRLKLTDNIEVSGECVKSSGSFKVEVSVEPDGTGEISCKTKDGTPFTELFSCPKDTELIFTLKVKDARYQPKSLTIGTSVYDVINSKGEIESPLIKVKGNLKILGSMELIPNYFQIDIGNVENGKIRCTNEDGSAYKQFDKVREGTKLKFTLAPNDGWVASKLVVNNKEYINTTVDGFIISELVTVNSSFAVTGECKKEVLLFKIDVENVEHGIIECKDKDGKPFNSFTNCVEGTQLIFSLKSTNAKWNPKKLIVGDNEYTNKNSNNVIEGSVTVTSNLVIRGEMEKILGHYSVTVNTVNDGSISCKDKKTNQNVTNYTDIVEDTVLVFTLIANNKTTHLPSKLIIDGNEYTTLNAEGNIEGEVVVNKSGIVVSGECVVKNAGNKHKITITNPQGAIITCTKEDGGIIADLNSVEGGTNVKIVLQASNGYHAKSLKIASQIIQATEKTKIEKLWVVQQDLTITGECVPYFPITLSHVENGEISCNIKDGEDLTGSELLEVEKGVELVFTLKASVEGFAPKTLVVDGKDYTEVENDEIIAEVTITKAIVVSGIVEKAEIQLNGITLSHERITAIEKTPKDANGDNVIILPAVPMKVEYLYVDLDVSPSSASVLYNPQLQDSKWILNAGENTLEITVGTMKYVLKTTRIDVELKTISMLKEDYPDGGHPKRITFTKGDYKTNQHFTFVEDTDGDEYLTFGLKQGIYECADEDTDEPLYKYTAILKSDPPKQISGTFSIALKHPNTGRWDMQPPVTIDKDSYSDADPFFPDNMYPNVVLDDAALGMWIPLHLFAADFLAASTEANLEMINIMVRNVSGNISTDLSDDNTDLIGFGDGDSASYSLKKCNNLKISNETQKILVHVLLDHAVANVTSINLKGEGTVAPSGDGLLGFYRYIEFNDTLTGKDTITISYQSGDGKLKKTKNIKIERSDASGNTAITSIRVCGVEAVRISDGYQVTLPKAGPHIGKVEVVFENPDCSYSVKTYEYDADEDQWYIGSDITKKTNVNFAKEENQELGISVTPKLGILYKRFFSVKVKIAE